MKYMHWKLGQVQRQRPIDMGVVPVGHNATEIPSSVLCVREGVEEYVSCGSQAVASLAGGQEYVVVDV